MSRDRRLRKEHRRRWPWVLGGLAVLAIIIASCSGGKAPTAGTTNAPAGAQGSSSTADAPTTLEVTGTGRAQSISYMDSQGHQAQANGKTLPWHVDLPADTSFGFVSMTAQSGSSKGSATITCTIRQGGQVIQTNTSEGAYAVVSCSGTP